MGDYRDGLLALGSPRDMIRLAQRILGEETRLHPQPKCVSSDGISQGIHEFAVERSRELFPTTFVAVSRLHRATFTQASMLSARVYATRDKAAAAVSAWKADGIIRQLPEKETKGKAQVMYTLADPRVAVAIAPAAKVQDVLADQVFLCPTCDELCVSERLVNSCSNDHVFERHSLFSLWSHCMQARSGD